MTVLGEEKRGFGYIILRPGTLTDDGETGRISFGRSDAKVPVSRGNVAEVATQLLGKEGARGWFDLSGGEEETEKAVERVLREGVNSRDGEDLEAMKKEVASL